MSYERNEVIIQKFTKMFNDASGEITKVKKKKNIKAKRLNGSQIFRPYKGC